MQRAALELFQGFQHRTVALLKKTLGNVHSIIRIDADQVDVERCMVDLGQRQAVRHDRLAQQFVLVGNDVRRIEQAMFAQSRQGTATAVGGDDGFAERVLMQTLFHDPQGVAALCRLRRCREVVAFGQAERNARFERRRIPPGNEGRDQSLVSARRDAEKVDDGNLVFVSVAQPTVVSGFRVGTHERVVDGFVALVDLPMGFAQVVVPDLAAASRHDGLDGQQETHLARFEDAALRVDEWDARAVEVEPRAQQFGGQLAVDLGEPSDMLEGSETHPGVIGEMIDSARHACPNRRPC